MPIFPGRRTPTTPAGLHQYDSLPAVQAVVKAWTVPGGHPDWHDAMREHVRLEMPVLARALDRLANVVHSTEGERAP